MSRNRWVKRMLAGLLALGPTSGCKQQLFLEPGDYHDAVMNTLPRGLETNPHDTIVPDRVDQIANPATVLDPNRPARFITLKECIAIALEQGNTGSQGQPGLKVDNLPGFNAGQYFNNTDSIRVLAIDPAIVASDLERALSKFDARWITSLQWQKIDQPVAVQFVKFQNSQDTANLTSTLAKPLPTGGVAGITFSTNYSKFDSGASPFGNFVNPNYTPRVQFTFEQPLLRLFGVEINQLTPNHPGSQLLNIQPLGGNGTQGILINRIRLDQQKAAFDIRVNGLLLSVEAAYWNLYAAYYNLYAQTEGLRQAYEGFRFTQIRVQIGTDPPQNLDQARAQFERFRSQVYEARGQVLDAERQLRGHLSLRSDDGTRLVPIDQPNLAPYQPDFNEAANETMANLPELLIARQDLKTQQLNLLLQKNLRRPDLRAFGTYDIAGLGTRLDGREFADDARTIPGNALTSLANNQFNSWTIGFRLDIPIGFRDANALVRQAQLNLAKSYYGLRDSELKALEILVDRYRRVIQTHALIGTRQAEREALQQYVAKIKILIDTGRWQPADFLNYLTVQQQLAAALANEFRAVADYNTALAAFEYAKGTIQQYNNVTVSEGPLPPWAQKKAADHIRERTEAALKLRERDVTPPPGGPGILGGGTVGPAVGTGLVDKLPPFALPQEPVPDKLPEGNPADPKMVPKLQPKSDQLVPPMGSSGASRSNTSPNGLPNIPRSLPVSNSQGSPAPNGTGPAAGDYFEPVGTVGLPPRGVNGPATRPSDATAPPASSTGGTVKAPPVPTGSLPAPPALDPLPVPPLSNIKLPAPPALPNMGADAVEFGPAGSVLPLPAPPETRYPSSAR